MNLTVIEKQLAKFSAETPVPPSFNGQIIRGYCLKVMRALPSESFKCVVTSPPFNIKNSSGNGLKNGSGCKWPKAALLLDTKTMKIPCHMMYMLHGNVNASMRCDVF